jgi:hypothetical protein
MALLWLVGLVLLGVAQRRSGVLPGPVALTPVGAAVAFTVFGGLLVPVLSPLSVLALGIGYVWVGVSLWTGAVGRERRLGRDQSRDGGGPGNLQQHRIGSR